MPSFLRKRLCKKPLGRVTCGKPNPRNPPYQGDFPYSIPPLSGDFLLNSPLIRGARGVRKDEYWIFTQSRKQQSSLAIVPAKETVQETTRSCYMWKTQPPKSPLSGGLSLLNSPLVRGLSLLNSPLIRGARGVRKDEC